MNLSTFMDLVSSSILWTRPLYGHLSILMDLVNSSTLWTCPLYGHKLVHSYGLGKLVHLMDSSTLGICPLYELDKLAHFMDLMIFVDKHLSHI